MISSLLSLKPCPTSGWALFSDASLALSLGIASVFPVSHIINIVD